MRFRRARRSKRAPVDPRAEFTDPEPVPDYSGPALLDAPGIEMAVRVALTGHLDPTDGQFHWYGRVSAANGAELPDPGRGQVFLTLPGSAPAPGGLQERDPWGNLRIVGVGIPPFPL